jgi:hypothetical protein
MPYMMMTNIEKHMDTRARYTTQTSDFIFLTSTSGRRIYRGRDGEIAGAGDQMLSDTFQSSTSSVTGSRHMQVIK